MIGPNIIWANLSMLPPRTETLFSVSTIGSIRSIRWAGMRRVCNRMCNDRDGAGQHGTRGTDVSAFSGDRLSWCVAKSVATLVSAFFSEPTFWRGTGQPRIE